MMLRLLDILLSLMGLILTSPLLVVLTIVGLFDTGSPLLRQTRVGRNKKPFTLFKLRTMRLDAPHVATHLADVSAVTCFGKFLRRTKLDELPQLWNVLKGEMSIVGPRPCLFSQKELIGARERLGVLGARPGITGLAQVNNIDMSSPQLLATIDAQMLVSLGVKDYFRYVFMTAAGKGYGDPVIAGKSDQ